jgi:hypothetical protein
MSYFHVYAIINSHTLDAYIGYSSQSPGQRLSAHVKELNQGTHHCQRLQAAWKWSGPELFNYTILAELGEVSRDTAKMVEGVYMVALGSYNEMMDNQWSDAMRLTRGKHSARMCSEPGRRQNHAKKLQTIWNDPELRKAYDNRKTRWVDPGEKAKHSEHLKALWADPERRQRLEARRAARWADPEAKARQGEKMRAYHAARRARLQDV